MAQTRMLGLGCKILRLIARSAVLMDKALAPRASDSSIHSWAHELKTCLNLLWIAAFVECRNIFREQRMGLLTSSYAVSRSHAAGRKRHASVTLSPSPPLYFPLLLFLLSLTARELKRESLKKRREEGRER